MTEREFLEEWHKQWPIPSPAAPTPASEDHAPLIEARRRLLNRINERPQIHARDYHDESRCDVCAAEKLLRDWLREKRPAPASEPTGELPDGPIYGASRASLPERPAMWRRLRGEGWPINCSWIDESDEGCTDDFAELWLRITNEIRAASKVVLYAEAGDFPLKGAILEAGIALGMGKPVVVCLPGVTLEGRTTRPIGSWIAHPLVTRIDSIREALAHCPNLPANAELSRLRAERDRLNGILLRIAAHITPIRDADKEQQHANDMHDTMGKIDELDDIVNSRVCDLECDVAQLRERLSDAKRELAARKADTFGQGIKCVWCGFIAPGINEFNHETARDPLEAIREHFTNDCEGHPLTALRQRLERAEGALELVVADPLFEKMPSAVVNAVNHARAALADKGATK